jgi:carbon storage regulator CsrA
LTERTQQRILVASDGTPFFFFCMEARVLVLKRKPDEDVVIVTPSGESIVVSVLGVRNDHVSLGFQADKAVLINRREVFEAMKHKSQPGGAA